MEEEEEEVDKDKLLDDIKQLQADMQAMIKDMIKIKEEIEQIKDVMHTDVTKDILYNEDATKEIDY